MAKLKVDLTLKNAQSLAQKGNYLEARRLYQTVLATFPGNSRALQGLALVEKQIKLKGANTSINETIKTLGGLLSKGFFQDAIEQSQEILKQRPDVFVIWYILGIASIQLGKLNQAISAFDQAISIKPDYIEAHLNRGFALQMQGLHEKAIASFQKVLSIKPDLPQAHNNIGNALRQQGKLSKAIAAYQKALSINPAFPEALYNLGRCWQDLEQMEEAQKAYLKVLSIKPDLPEANNDLGTVYLEQRKFDEAAQAFSNAIRHRPQFSEAHSNLGTALHEQGHIKEAIASCNKALSLNPEHVSAYNNLGVIYTSAGEPDKALEAYTKALSIKPDDAQTLYNISSHVDHTPDDPQIALIEGLLRKSDLASKDKILLHYTLAKIYEETGQLEASLKHYKAGGALQIDRVHYTIEKDEELFEKIRQSAPSIRAQALAPSRDDETVTPIFILGMPRSGTTLIEQIISHHTQVYGSGELDHATNLGLKMSSGAVAATQENLKAFRQTYLSELKRSSEGKAYATDKMPNNFRQIGLICSALPEAKIIHVKRDAAATCWSNFKTRFVGNGLGYSYDLQAVVRFYKLYEDLMTFWNQTYGDRIIEVDYDALTINPDTEIRKMISDLSLDWQDSCLSPHTNKRMVKTASNLQIRKSIYKNSSKEWLQFQPFLDGAFDELLT
nr:tetratricopeptide repeat protein [uncultured Cohaesibacter sp.]